MRVGGGNTHCLSALSCANFSVMVMVPVDTAAAVTFDRRAPARAQLPLGRGMRAGLSAGARVAGTAPALAYPLDAVVRVVGAGRHAALASIIGML
jgi:hypothetical protein